MQRTIDETNRRRKKQSAYNQEHGIEPKQIIKSTQTLLAGYSSRKQKLEKESMPYGSAQNISIAADPVVKYMNEKQLQEAIKKTRKSMESAAKELDFIEAARLRDEMFTLEGLLKQKKSN